MIRLVAVSISLVCMWLLLASIAGEERLNGWDRRVRGVTRVLRASARRLRRQCADATRDTLRTSAGGRKTPLIPIALDVGLVALFAAAQPRSALLAVVIALTIIVISPCIVYLIYDVLRYTLVGVAALLISLTGLFLIALLWVLVAPYLILDMVRIQSTPRRMCLLAGLLLGGIGASLADL